MALSGIGALAAAQLPPPPVTIEMMQAELVAKSGSDTVYFAGRFSWHRRARHKPR